VIATVKISEQVKFDRNLGVAVRGGDQCQPSGSFTEI